MLAINLPVDVIRRYPDEFVLSVHSCRTPPGRQDPLRVVEAKATCSDALDERGVGLVHLKLQLRGDEQALSLGYREKPGSGGIIPILARIQLRFDTIAWRPERCSFCEGGCDAAGASRCPSDEPKIVAECADVEQGTHQPARHDPAAPVDLRVPSLFHPDGKAYEGPLQQALNAFRDSGFIAHERNLWATSLRRPWVIVRNDTATQGPSSRMWVTTLADAAGHPRTSPLVFETRQKVHEGVQELLLSPTHDLFLAVVRNTEKASRSGVLWLGRIVREGDTYRAVAYRVRHFADINRRYPEARLSLEALKAEMR